MIQVPRRHGGGWSRSGSAVRLRRFNQMPLDEAAELLQTCLPVQRWVGAILEARPFRHLEDLFEVARDAAFPFTPAELEAAVASYSTPDVDVMAPSRRGDPATETRLRQQLQTGIESYDRRFARPFVIRTDGRLPAQILVQLWDRLGHDVDAEDLVVAQQLREIALLHLANVVST